MEEGAADSQTTTEEDRLTGERRTDGRTRTVMKIAEHFENAGATAAAAASGGRRESTGGE